MTVINVRAQETERLNPTLEKGIGQYKHENYDEALITLKKAREEVPQSTLAAYYLGLTYKQLQNYKNAVSPLREAVTGSPKIIGALVELIDCLYQVGQLDEAMKWVEEAEKEGLRPAQIAFLKGLVLIKMEKQSDAVASFENAKGLDKSMAQSCDYQIGLAYLKDKKFGEAKDAFKQLVLVDPNSNMAYLANEYMDVISKREEATKPFKLGAGISWQYDDNVVLKPSDTSIATNISDKADSREVYTANAEYNYTFNEFVSLKGQYFFYYSKQNDLGFYDSVSNTVVGQPVITFKNCMITFPSGWSHSIVNDKAYLSAPFTSAFCNIMVNNWNMAQLNMRFTSKDYLWSPSAPDENRDSSDFGGGAGWYVFFAKNKGFVNARYQLNKEETKGNNWDYIGNRASATVLVPVIDKLNLTVNGDVLLQGYLNTNSIFNVRRHDQIYTVSALAAYKIYKESEIQLQYTFVKDDSNISVYGYNRNIFSVGIEGKF